MASSINFGYKVLSFNICYSKRAEGVFERFSSDKRIEQIFQLLSDENADIICLQEVYEKDLNTFTKRLKDYNFTEQRHSERSGCCYNLIGVRKSIMFNNKNIEVRIPKSINMCNNVREIMSCVMCLELDNLIIINCHVPVTENLRFLANEHIKSVLRPHKPVIVVGDFNSFPDYKGVEQLQNLIDLTGLVHYDNDYKSSFAAYPYDVFEAKETIPLDNLFYKNIVPHDFRFISDRYTFEFDKKTYFISDHFAMVFTI